MTLQCLVDSMQADTVESADRILKHLDELGERVKALDETFVVECSCCACSAATQRSSARSRIS